MPPSDAKEPPRQYYQSHYDQIDKRVRDLEKLEKHEPGSFDAAVGKGRGLTPEQQQQLTLLKKARYAFWVDLQRPGLRDDSEVAVVSTNPPPLPEPVPVPVPAVKGPQWEDGGHEYMVGV